MHPEIWLTVVFIDKVESVWKDIENFYNDNSTLSFTLGKTKVQIPIVNVRYYELMDRPEGVKING